MASFHSPLSHRQDILSQIVDNDPIKADLLFELLVITDASTPIGAAAHADTLDALYPLTEECHQRCRERQERVRAANQ
jgi:hypothetical protein